MRKKHLILGCHLLLILGTAECSSSQPKLSNFQKYGDAYVLDEATGKIWTKCMLGQNAETCAGDYVNMTYTDAQAACEQIQFKNLKFRIPSRQEYFFAFVTCSGNGVSRVRNITSDLNEYDNRKVVARNNPDTFSMSLENPTCILGAKDELRSKNLFPTLTHPLWTSTWAYKLFNDKVYCSPGDPIEKCATISLSHQDETEFKNHLETYHSVFQPWLRDFALELAIKGKDVSRPTHTPGRANAYCVADMLPQ